MERDLTFTLSKHASDQMVLRGISEDIVWKTILKPDQIVNEEGRKCINL